MPYEAPKALLFDLGGVLVDIDFGRALDAWAPYSSFSRDELAATFKLDEQYERHERGEVSGPAYFQHLSRVLRLKATPEQIEGGWNAIFVGEITPTRRALELLRGSIPLYAFTNTNASHMARWTRQFPEVVAALDRIFTSHQLGLRKPEKRAFERICELANVHPAGFVFFDDLAENVAGAIEAGLQGVHVRGPHDVLNALQSLGFGAK
jgi:glucose-1-phosphatase